MHVIPGFPAIHSSPLVKWQKVNNFSLLYVVSGANVQLQPYLLLAHLDVVPADDATKWDFPPFSAEIHDGFLYGRGAIDTKDSLFVRNCHRHNYKKIIDVFFYKFHLQKVFNFLVLKLVKIS